MIEEKWIASIRNGGKIKMPNNIDLDIQKLIEVKPSYNNSTDMFEVIVKYHGYILKLEADVGAEVEILSERYAIVTLPINKIPLLYNYNEIEYIEIPKNLTFSLDESLSSSCIPYVQSEQGYNLRGKGTIIGIIDSGIDYTHIDFVNEDGTSRILYIWNQTAEGNPPQGFRNGIEYNNNQLNLALSSNDPFDIVPQMDIIGHGTAIAGIAAGNGRASLGFKKGVAPEASLIIVKLGQKGRESFARTTEIMRAFKYILDKSKLLNMPVAINLSFGTNNGSHDGNSLFETFIDDMAMSWKSSIIVAAGNEGAAGHHFASQISQGETINVDFVTSGNLNSLYIALWKNFVDSFTFELITPTGLSTGIISPDNEFIAINIDGISIQSYYGQPTHYNEDQEIFFSFQANGSTIPVGLWTIVINGIQVTDGSFDIWLPTTEEVSYGTVFSRPSLNTTITLPSTARNVISVGGYNSGINSAALFSGRGYTRGNHFVKPDLVAPSVNIVSTKTGGRIRFFYRH